jgi:hypothetical protein
VLNTVGVVVTSGKAQSVFADHGAFSTSRPTGSVCRPTLLRRPWPAFRQRYAFPAAILPGITSWAGAAWVLSILGAPCI